MRITVQRTIQYPNDQQINEALRTPYHYRPLKIGEREMQLVKVGLTRDNRGWVFCNLQHHTTAGLVVNRTYDAVSHAQGDSSHTENILSDDSQSPCHLYPHALPPNPKYRTSILLSKLKVQAVRTSTTSRGKSPELFI
jgi:hypothetical protein